MSTDIKDLQQKSKLPAKQAGISTVKEYFNTNKNAIMEAAPEHLNTKRMLSVALSAIRTTPKLRECTTESLFGSILACAQLGLEPNTPNGHAYLVPFKNNKANRMDVQVIIGYRGMLDMARRSGNIESISAHAVYEQDEFSYEYGLNEHCKHIPAEGDRGEITHFYCTARYVGGGHNFLVMTRHEVEQVRDQSQNWKQAKRYNKEKFSPWYQHFAAMGEKTVMRRLYKWLPTSVEMQVAARLEEQRERGEEQTAVSNALDGDFIDITATSVDYEGDIDGEAEEEEPGQEEAAPAPKKKASKKKSAKKAANPQINSEKKNREDVPAAGEQTDAAKEFFGDDDDFGGLE